jgi:2-polyprenyl-6-methoxyphenol hydroxylase-like FAD-dependent oxidoreductase
MSRDHAVVAGGSIAGLITARVLSDHFGEVTIVERDELPDGAENRKGVPQGRQVHGCLEFGMRIHEELFPGFVEGIQRDGSPKVDFMKDMAFWTPFGWRARAESDLYSVGFTRPHWEDQVRRRVLALPNVKVMTARVENVTASEDRKAVTGIVTADGTEVEADLVVDATGRGSRARKWVEELGYAPPEEIQVLSHMGYAGRLVEVSEDAFPNEARAVVGFPYPEAPRGGGIFTQENGLYILYGIGMIKDYPPLDADEFMDFVGDMPTPLVRQIAEQATPVTDIHSYHMPGSYMRLWDQLDERPQNLVVTGDAVAAYNPIFGQGISVASMGARVLGDLLEELDDLATLPERFQKEFVKTTTWAFNTAGGSDMVFEGVELIGVERPSGEGHEYMVQLQKMMTYDAFIGASFQHAFGNMDIEFLSSDPVRTRVEAWVAEGEPMGSSDPTRIPDVSDVPVELKAVVAG